MPDEINSLVGPCRAPCTIGKQQMAIRRGEIDVAVLDRKPVFGLPDRHFAGSAGHCGKNAGSAGEDVQHDENGRRDIRREATKDLLHGD